MIQMSHLEILNGEKWIWYYSNKMGDKLVKKVESVAYSKNTSLERIIVEQLIKGPGDSTMNSTLPSDLKLLSISVSDGICYVNLSSHFN